MTPTRFQQLANFIWSVADLLRGLYRPPQYERVMLPLTVLRRFDAVLAPSKDAVLKRHGESRPVHAVTMCWRGGREHVRPRLVMDGVDCGAKRADGVQISTRCFAHREHIGA